jgi:uncharacterized cupredoxin-like copper-binding protein
MNAKTRIFGLLVLVLAVVGLAACSGGGQAQSSAGAKLDVSMTEMSFTPATMTVPAGKQVTLNIKNDGKVQHQFIIMKKGVTVTPPFGSDQSSNIYWQVQVDPGQSQTTTFTAPADAGDYEVICGIPGHLEAGMKATLTVQ